VGFNDVEQLHEFGDAADSVARCCANKVLYICMHSTTLHFRDRVDDLVKFCRQLARPVAGWYFVLLWDIVSRLSLV